MILQDIITLANKKYNVDLSIYNQQFLEKTVLNRMNSLKYLKIKEYYTEIEYNNEELPILQKLLLVSYSMFFRNGLSFELLKSAVLPAILMNDNKHEIRIWSAGCAIGQEPYSIAMTIENMIDKLKIDIKYRIFATDVSLSALEKAKKGEYNVSEIGNLTYANLERYFTVKNNQYSVNPNIQKNIIFSYYDLMETSSCCPKESVYGNFDIVFCSNILFYYRQDIQEQIINKISRVINDDGFLFAGETEKWIYENNFQFQVFTYNGAVFQKRMKKR